MRFLKQYFILVLFIFTILFCANCSSGDEEMIVETDFEGNIVGDHSPDDWQPRLDPDEVFKHVLSIRPAYPNPTDSVLHIGFAISERGAMNIGVYKGGVLFHQLVEQQMAAGQHSVLWNLKGDSDRRLGSGFYKIRFIFTPGGDAPVESSGTVHLE